MAEETAATSAGQTLEYHLVTLFEKLETLRRDSPSALCGARLPVQVEIRALEFWRSVISECLASFVYVFIVCGAVAGAGIGASAPSVLLASALAAGFAMTSLTQCFGHISGAHINPAVSIAMGLTKKISLFRSIAFVVAQCGGAIAGTAFLHGVTVQRYQSNLAITFTHSINEAPWEKFGIELILSFVVVFSYFVSMDSHRKLMGTAAITIGATYSACSFVSMPFLNPARSLGPSFVLNRWENHWVYWVGPILGGSASGLVYEYIFNGKNRKKKEPHDADLSSMHSDEDAYDDLDKPLPPKFHGSTYNTYRSAAAANGPSGYCPSLASTSLYSAPTSKMEREESLYGGTKSLYCKSPPLTRANLNRSQSVYTKSNTGVHRDALPKPGPLLPAQSLYPMRLNQQSHVQNQNLQNQLQQRSESMYGARGIAPGATSRADYRAAYEEGQKACGRPARPESMYGMLNAAQQQRRNQSAQSDDSSYGSYQGPPPAPTVGTYLQPKGPFRGAADGRQPPNPQLINAANASICHHSPKGQY